MSDLYKTIIAPGEAQIREKMSRFIAFAVPVQSADQAKALIKEYTNKYHDARHLCWAYMVGPQRDTWQLSDNGEPSGTAGKPILGQINSFELTDILIMVVRYFGGIKLGTSGLIAAYRQAAREAIEATTIEERHEQCTLTVRFPYLGMNSVMKILKKSDAQILDQQFDNSCSITLRIRRDHLQGLRDQLRKEVDGLSLPDDDEQTATPDC